MSKNFEYNIRLKAAIVYIIVAIAVTIMLFLLNGLRKNINSQRKEVEKHSRILALTNQLTYSVSEVQSLSLLYLSTRNEEYLSSFNHAIQNVDALIDTVSTLKPEEKETLQQIQQLLLDQAINIARLKTEFSKANPVTALTERLQAYQDQNKKDSSMVVIKSDTLIKQLPKKAFFKRLAEVFKPSKESTEMVIKQRIDTIKGKSNDSINFIDQVSEIAEQAGVEYQKNITSIEKQVSQLTNTNYKISAEISTLLLKLHNETLNSTLIIINNSEVAIKKNYTYSIIGSTVALVLILIFVILIISDINKGKRARQELEEANIVIKRTMESRHQLLLSVSHDIKSPLNSILGYLELMESNNQIRSMQNSGQHILSMLENLLEFSSLEQGTSKKSLSDFNLFDLHADIYEMFYPLAQKKHLKLSFDADDIHLHSDVIKIKQIIINLVSNAIKYTTNGTVEFTSTYKDGVITIKISDTGVGIPIEKQSQLFQPFSRIEENNKLASGSGLGMYVVKGLVELLGGTITLSSQVAEGTTITITLMAERAQEKLSGKSLRIQVYDDDPTMVRVATDLLVRLGHQVINENPEQILTDMDMGDLSGIDILKQAGNIPVVVMTGQSDFTTEKAFELGFSGFIPKPISLDSLRESFGQGECFEDLLSDDMPEIIALFKTSAIENLNALQEAYNNDDYSKAQSICHKMLPMFAQMQLPIDELRKMDMNRDTAYDGWKSDVEKILSITI